LGGTGKKKFHSDPLFLFPHFHFIDGIF
jgi:hypothetical protein